MPTWKSGEDTSFNIKSRFLALFNGFMAKNIQASVSLLYKVKMKIKSDTALNALNTISTQGTFNMVVHSDSGQDQEPH